MNISQYLVNPRAKFDLAEYDPADKSLINGDKDAAKLVLEGLSERLEVLQSLFYATGTRKLLIVLQAMDTAGKDSTIRMVFDGVNPQGVRVANFKAPTDAELAHDFLWRIHAQTPANREIVIFNRSHYEDVLITRVNGWIDDATCHLRYGHIREFEELLAENGTAILKFYLHISKDEQKKRLLERRDDPAKQWKFNPGDLVSRAQWDDYQSAYAQAIAATSTPNAPWYVVPANSKLQRNLIVATVICETLEGMNLRYPKPLAGIGKIKIE